MSDEAAFTAGDLMNRDVAVVHPETSLLGAVNLMARRGISGMPVVDESGAIVGMISDGDLVRWNEGYTERQARWLDILAEGYDIASTFLQRIQEQNRKVKTVMTPGAVTVTEETPAREVAHLMYAEKIKRVPVVCNGKLVGIVARSDLIRALAQKLGENPDTQTLGPKTINEALRLGREGNPPPRKEIGSQ